MTHPLEHILGVRDDARSLSDAALFEAILKPLDEHTDAAVMVKNLLAAEAVERGLEADDPIINFPSVLLACGDADHSIIPLLPEAMRERAMESIVKGAAMPLEIAVAPHGFELRLRPDTASQDKPSITNRVARIVERIIAAGSMEKRIEQRGDQWCVIAETSGRNMGCYDSREAAEERLSEIERFAKAETFTPPNGVRNAAKRALGWIGEGKQGDGFTTTGRARAAQLARGGAVSLETVKRMHSFFSRHAPDKQAEGFSMGEKGYPSPGRVAWDAWGGDAGARWAAGIAERVEKNGEYETSEPLLNDRQKAMYVAYEKIAEMLGPWDGGTGANGAHYMEEHPFVDSGMICGNCAFYEAVGKCEILSQPVNALGVCKLWIIPESVIGAQTVAEKANPYRDRKSGQFSYGPGGKMESASGAAVAGGFNADATIDQLDAGNTANVDGANVGAVFSRMAERDGNPDVTELHINGTALLGDEGLGYRRDEMPQIPPHRRGDFMGELQSTRSIATVEQDVDPRGLRPIQSEISGKTAGAIYRDYREGGVPTSERIIVSRDNYVVDGHHTWAASVAIAFDGGSQTIPVYRINADHLTVLQEAHSFADAIGSGRLSIDAPPLQKSGALWFEYEIEKANPYRDKKTGQFTFGPGRETPLGGTSRPVGSTTSRGVYYETAYDGATGGYKAGIPQEISAADSPVGEALNPSHSLWHHMERNPDWDGRDPQQQYRITPERQRLHEQIINGAVGPVPAVPEGEEKIFVMLGGGPAAGKSSGLRNDVFTGVPAKGNYVDVNPDEVKVQLPEFDGLRYSSSNIEFKAASSFVHEESSMVAKMQQRAALAKGTHIVVDGTGDGKPGSLRGKAEAARASGYSVRGRYATVETDVAWGRAVDRAQRQRRYVPESVVRGTHKAVTPAYMDAAATGLFDDLQLIWTGGNSPVPLLVHQVARGSSAQILNPAQWRAFMAKADE